MYIGVDLGGTNVRIASFKDLKDIKFEKIGRFELSHNFNYDFGKIIQAINETSDGKVEAIGIGTPGTYNDDRSLLISGRNVQEWTNVPFIERLSKEFNCPAFADNDAVVASLGEAFYGQGKNKNFIYITWGTGIGGSVVRFENGEVSSEKIDWHKYFETFNGKCAGKEVAIRYNKSIDDLSEDNWAEIMNDFEFHLAEISKEFNEKNIILGGGATSRQKERLQKVADNLESRGINLYLSELNDEIGLYGAMALVKTKGK